MSDDGWFDPGWDDEPEDAETTDFTPLVLTIRDQEKGHVVGLYVSSEWLEDGAPGLWRMYQDRLGDLPPNPGA